MFSGVDDVLCLQIPDDLVRNGSGHRREDSRRWGRFCFSHQLPVEVWVWTRLFSPLQRTLCSRPSGTPKLSGTTIAVALGSSWRSTSTRRCSGLFSLSRSRALTSADESYELQMKPNGGTYSARSVYVDLSAFVKRRDLPSAVSDAYAA